MLNNLGDLIWLYSYAYLNLNSAANTTGMIPIYVKSVLIGADKYLYTVIL